MEKETKIKDENYFQISGFMVNRLGLKGNDLMVYAIVYGFSQDGETWFNGSRQYLSDFTGASKSTIDRTLLGLQEKGLLIKHTEIKNGVSFNIYKAVLPNDEGVFKMTNDTLSKMKNGVVKMNTNNIDNNNSIIDNIVLEKEFKEKDTKHKYGEYGRVLLTDEQYKKLVEEYDKAFIDDVIAKVDAYVESNNNKNKYSNYYAVIKNAINGKWFNIKEYTKPKPITTLEENDEVKQEHITIRAKTYFENLYNTDRDKYYSELEKLKSKNPTLAKYVVNQVENGGFEEL